MSELGSSPESSSSSGQPVPQEPTPTARPDQASRPSVGRNTDDVQLEIRVEGDDRVNWAMQQNDVPVVEQLSLRNTGEAPLDELLVRVTLGDLAPPWEARILSLLPGATWNLDPIDLRPDPARLARQLERESITLRVEVLQDDVVE